MVEVLTQHYTLSRKLRLPAVSRLQKVHNTEVVLASLGAAGCHAATTASAKDIVDGHREATLALLWGIVFNFQVCIPLDVCYLGVGVEPLLLVIILCMCLYLHVYSR